MSAIKKIKVKAFEEDILVKRDEVDPIYKVLDDGVLTDQQIFSLLGWEAIDQDFIASIAK
ncbi:MAG: hypothetical protein NTV47_03370 [Actinobacteria bacterium]|nr:hypothetical protein [Actinomycetota bacterium]